MYLGSKKAIYIRVGHQGQMIGRRNTLAWSLPLLQERSNEPLVEQFTLFEYSSKKWLEYQHL